MRQFRANSDETFHFSFALLYTHEIWEIFVAHFTFLIFIAKMLWHCCLAVSEKVVETTKPSSKTRIALKNHCARESAGKYSDERKKFRDGLKLHWRWLHNCIFLTFVLSSALAHTYFENCIRRTEFVAMVIQHFVVRIFA